MPVIILSNCARNHDVTTYLGSKITSDVWHSRLGHSLAKLVHHLINSHSLHTSGKLINSNVCSSCQLGKNKKLVLFDLIVSLLYHLNLSTLMYSLAQLHLNACHYYSIFIDAFSRFTWLYPIIKKSNMLSCFTKYKCLVENLFSTKIKQLQSDGDGEYMS